MPQNRVPKGDFLPLDTHLCRLLCIYKLNFYGERVPTKIQPYTQNFAKTKSQNSIVTFIFRSHDFTVHGFFIINFPCSKWKSPENPLRNSESFPDFCCSAKVFADAKNRTSASTDPVKITMILLCYTIILCVFCDLSRVSFGLSVSVIKQIGTPNPLYINTFSVR